MNRMATSRALWIKLGDDEDVFRGAVTRQHRLDEAQQPHQHRRGGRSDLRGRSQQPLLAGRIIPAARLLSLSRCAFLARHTCGCRRRGGILRGPHELLHR